MKRSVILTDRLGPDILLVLTMKRQVLHHERAHLKVPGCSLVLSGLLTKKSVGPVPSVGLTLTWFIWDRNLALHVTLHSRQLILFII